MSTRDDPYSRLYWRFKDEYPGVWDDDHELATWVRLLVGGDQAWPASPSLPRSVAARALSKLETAGLVARESGDRYRVRGQKKERERRSSAGRAGAYGRWGDTDANAMQTDDESQSDRNANAMPAEQSRAETSKAETRGGARADVEDEPEGDALTWLARHGCYVNPGNGYHRHLITAVERHGCPAIVGMFDRLSRAGVKDGDTKGFLFGAVDALNGKPNLKALEAEDRERETDAQRARRAEANERRLAEYRTMTRGAS